METWSGFDNPEGVRKGLQNVGYIASDRIANTVYLASHLVKPILVEGPAGVGKTELAKATAAFMGIPLIRLQCYEGLDESKALYEWKYGKQLLYTQLLKDKLDRIVQGEMDLSESIEKLHQYDDIFFSPRFLEPRPLLKALQQKQGAVLLVDEVDKSDDEFEAFLLEILSDFQVSIPEIGTIEATSMPFVFLTSNNTRELSEALQRRCLHLYISFPDERLEREIVRTRVPDITEKLNRQLVAFINKVRQLDIRKLPSVSETIDWARTLVLLHADNLDREMVKRTLNTFLKTQQDIQVAESRLDALTEQTVREVG
ncbi:MAG TPA: MoxR family ATPase [Syntrophales bacterium]|nr:MoxR family ATPase [Syntrophales bacterium]HQB29938.1 MoxR family ATPase [Syntrophales bacterium]HQN79010.1 MoxR family ATPase [Syntrophales bacterium]HQQ26032.1 MoxR family ATPase [Syntrophales bacterium]